MSNRIIIILIMLLTGFSWCCKDDNITSTYLKLTENFREEESLNLDPDLISLTVILKDEKFNEPVKNALLMLVLPGGSAMSGNSGNDGKAYFRFHKSLKGIAEISAHSADNLMHGKNIVEIPETFNYTLSIYLKE